MPKIKEERMKALEHMDNVFLWKQYNSANPFPKGTWNSEIFKNDHPIVLELACGKGEYSVGMGSMYPNKNFVGFDLKGNRLWVGATKALEENLENVRFFRLISIICTIILLQMRLMRYGSSFRILNSKKTEKN